MTVNRKKAVCALLLFLIISYMPVRTFAAGNADEMSSAYAGSRESAEEGVSMIAHKGYSSAAPENTLAAFRLAGMYGFWGAECDIRQTADGEWIILRDDRINRTTDGEGCAAEMNYSDILEYTVNAGNGLDQFPDEKIPLLKDYLDICKEYEMYAVMEIKCDVNVASIESLADILAFREEKERFIVISFNKNILLALRNILPDIKLYLVTRKFSMEDISFCTENRIDGIDFYISNSGSMIDILHESGLKSMVWTVDDVAMANRFRSLGVTAITTNTLAPLSQPTKKTAESHEPENDKETVPDVTEEPPVTEPDESTLSLLDRIIIFFRRLFE